MAYCRLTMDHGSSETNTRGGASVDKRVEVECVYYNGNCVCLVTVY